MTNTERILAILNYEKYDNLPIIHFGFWKETIQKWIDEGHLTQKEASELGHDGIAKKLGFDSGLSAWGKFEEQLYPKFESKIVKTLPDGSEHYMQDDGVIVLRKPDAGSIPAEIAHTLVDRESWEKHYLPRLQFCEQRVPKENIEKMKKSAKENDLPESIFCGSLFGIIRNWVGLENISYMQIDDEELFEEIINVVGDLCYNVVKRALEHGLSPQIAHFWEDIACKSGPLIHPDIFSEKCGPHYKKITDLLREYGCKLIYVDCDGVPDKLIPTWIENGINIMYPVEVGTWNASYAPWREIYGKELRAVGGMNKTVFAKDFADIDFEIERLKPIVALGGFIPMPDHRIAPDAKWENVKYYCKRMKEEFSA